LYHQRVEAGQLFDCLEKTIILTTVQPWIQSAPPKKYLIMANPAHNAPQNKIFLATPHNHAPPKKILLLLLLLLPPGLLLLLLLPGGLLVAHGGLLGAGGGRGGRGEAQGEPESPVPKTGHSSLTKYIHPPARHAPQN
jgi:hypothetical protein